MLEGQFGETKRFAMELLVASGQAMGASSMIDITGAHIDSCLFHGIAGLDFARTLVDGGGQVAVPTTLNVSSLDLLHPDLYRGDPDTAIHARALMEAYESLGCRATWTCAPYQLVERPVFGEQVAWGESNAIVFANSVLGARTERYGDFLDICCALTGRAPYVGLHTDAGRVATLAIDVAVGDAWLDSDLLYVALGLVLGKEAGTEVAVIAGLDERADEDRLKALGAAAASSGAVALFHVAGLTPEAATFGTSPKRRIEVGPDRLSAALSSLTEAGPLGAVSLGTPHASAAELKTLAAMCSGRRTTVPFYVNTGRDVAGTVGEAVQTIEEFGGSVVTDTCTYITPIIGEVEGVVMTNSGKWAYYAPGNLGVSVALGTMADCVESAVRGAVVRAAVLS